MAEKIFGPQDKTWWFHNGIKLEPLKVFGMAAITVKNIPDDLYDRLMAVAEINRRSINSEIIVCIEHAVTSHGINRDEMLENARRLRQLTAGSPISDEECNQAKSEGRL
jgi:plasmid stability protein